MVVWLEVSYTSPQAVHTSHQKKKKILDNMIVSPLLLNHIQEVVFFLHSNKTPNCTRELKNRSFSECAFSCTYLESNRKKKQIKNGVVDETHQAPIQQKKEGKKKGKILVKR